MSLIEPGAGILTVLGMKADYRYSLLQDYKISSPSCAAFSTDRFSEAGKRKA
jgi:hypothetical protein